LTKFLLETVQYGCKTNPAPALGKDPQINSLGLKMTIHNQLELW